MSREAVSSLSYGTGRSRGVEIVIVCLARKRVDGALETGAPSHASGSCSSRRDCLARGSLK